MKRIDPGNEGIVAHPLLSGGMARSTREYTAHDLHPGLNSMRVFEAVPLPEISEILCGFDAIYQFQVSALSEVLPQRTKDFSVEIDYEEELFDEDVRVAIAGVLYQPGIVLDTTHAYWYNNESLTVRLHSPRLTLEHGSTMAAKISWSAVLILNRVETVESFTARRGLIPPDDSYGRLPSARGPTGVDEGWGPEERVTQDVNLASGEVELTADCPIGQDAENYVIQAYIAKEGSSIEIRTDSSIFNTILDSELLALRSSVEYRIEQQMFSLWSRSTMTGWAAAITPRISFSGSLLPDGVGEGFDAFEISHKVTDGNRRFTKTLSLCIATGAGGDIDAVQPFIGNRNFAFAVSNDIIRSVVTSRWPTLDRYFTATVGDVEYNLSDGDNDYTGVGSARLRVTLQSLTDAGLVVGPDEDYVDALRLAGDHAIELTKFILEDGSELFPEDIEGDFGSPQTVPYSLHVFLFSPDPDPETMNETKEFLGRLSGELLQSIYYPFPDGHVHLDEYSGSTHSAAGLVLVKADAEY